MERVHPQDSATPSFFYELRSSLSVLSIDVSFVLKCLWKDDRSFRNLTSGQIYMEDPVVDVFVDSLQRVVLSWPFFGPPNNPFKKRSPVH